MSETKVVDLTVDELKSLIREVVSHTIVEALHDPDEGLDLREEVEVRLRQSIVTVEAGGETIPVQQVAARWGSEW